MDLNGEGSITRLYLSWETAYGKDFRLETSEDASNWTTVSTFTGNTLHYNEVNFTTPVQGRYVRMYGVTRGTGYGFSLYEFQVYGTLTPLATTPTPLPVSLTAFSATRQNSSVAVRWTTATEQNSASFTVQRSADGVSFASLATVAAAGTSYVAKEYACLDGDALPTSSYYRLRQLDRDGAVTYGPVVVVPATNFAATFDLFPSPVVDQATLRWTTTTAGVGRWSLTTTAGQVVHSEAILTQVGSNVQTLALRPYAAGSYLLTLEANGQVLGRARVQKTE